MARRTIQASRQGIKDIQKALKRKKGGQTYLAGAVGCSRQTIWSLLKGNPIDCDVFMDVCTELGLKWEDIAEPEAAEPVQNKDSNLDALVQEVRSRLLPFITAPHSIIGTMRMFSVSQPVPVDKIYIDLNVLEQVSCSRHFSNWRGEYEPGNRQDFDRLSLSKVKQPGVEAISVVKNYTKLLVLGKPGAGKTTFLKSLAVKCIQPEEEFFADLVPLFVTLPEFAKMAHKTSWDLFDYLASELAKQSNRCDANAKEILVQGRALVLLDGLDEVPPEDIENVIDAVRDFGYRNNRLVITCRTQSQKELEGFTDVEVADFTPKQVDRFVENWFNIVDSGTQASLASQLQQQLRAIENKTIAELTVTPVLLNLICAVFRDEQGNLPKKRFQLYEKGIRQLLERLKRMPSDRELTLEVKENFLAELAVMLFKNNDYFPEEQTLEKFICTYFGVGRYAAREILKIFETETGLLIERSAGYWSFSHLTFQEFLVAKWFMQHQDLQQLICYMYQEHWKEVFPLIISMLSASDSEKLLTLLQHRINHLIKHNKQLQEFLVWAKNKTDSLGDARYKPAAIRSFYIYFAELHFNCIQDLLYPARDILAYKIDPNFRQDVADSYKRHNTDPREFVFSLSNDIALDIAFALLFDADLLFTWAIRYMQKAIVYLETPPQLKLRLQSLIDYILLGPLTPPTEWKRCRSIMRYIMIKYRNIGQHKKFTDSQKSLFDKYYNANVLLWNCLHSSNCSFVIRQQIEDALLLPIAEIEKRKREKAE